MAQFGAAERRAERPAPDHHGSVPQIDVAWDGVLLIATIALERAEVDGFVGAAIEGAAWDEPDAQVGGRGRWRMT